MNDLQYDSLCNRCKNIEADVAKLKAESKQGIFTILLVWLFILTVVGLVSIVTGGVFGLFVKFFQWSWS